MRALTYRVGTKDYSTVCTTLASAKAQLATNPDFKMTIEVKEIKEDDTVNLTRARKLAGMGEWWKRVATVRKH